nr:uncharacterized protein LOC120967068 [Aegilops tauschii subsp. strangulata]
MGEVEALAIVLDLECLQSLKCLQMYFRQAYWQMTNSLIFLTPLPNQLHLGILPAVTCAATSLLVFSHHPVHTPDSRSIHPNRWIEIQRLRGAPVAPAATASLIQSGSGEEHPSRSSSPRRPVAASLCSKPGRDHASSSSNPRRPSARGEELLQQPSSPAAVVLRAQQLQPRRRLTEPAPRAKFVFLLRRRPELSSPEAFASSAAPEHRLEPRLPSDLLTARGCCLPVVFLEQELTPELHRHPLPLAGATPAGPRGLLCPLLEPAASSTITRSTTPWLRPTEAWSSKSASPPPLRSGRERDPDDLLRPDPAPPTHLRAATVAPFPSDPVQIRSPSTGARYLRRSLASLPASAAIPSSSATGAARPLLLFEQGIRARACILCIAVLRLCVPVDSARAAASLAAAQDPVTGPASRSPAASSLPAQWPDLQVPMIPVQVTQPSSSGGPMKILFVVLFLFLLFSSGAQLG